MAINESKLKELIEVMSDELVVALWNEYCRETNRDSEIFANDEEFFSIFFSDNPMEVARATYYGDYRFADEYVKFNGYGNLITTDYISEWVEIDELVDFCLENEEYIEMYDLEECLEEDEEEDEEE